jgi:hypothetical protein
VFIQQAHREGGVSFLKTILQDLRFAVRLLRKSPGLAFTAILVFALGIGASTAIFAFVDGALVKPLPYRDPSRLVALFERIPVVTGTTFRTATISIGSSSIGCLRPSTFIAQRVLP